MNEPVDVVAAQLQATRRLLRADEVGECIDALIELVRELGGDVGEPDGRSEQTSIDLSFGERAPIIVRAPAGSDVRRTVERVLSPTLEDARLAVGRIRQRRLVEHDAHRDHLTGLLNRRAFGRLLGRLGPEDCVAIADLDHFKDVNDAHGHAAGDALLRAFAQTVTRSLRVGDHAARLGGDEFALAFVGLPGREAGAVVERLREAWQDARSLEVSFSAGVAKVRTAGGARTALEEADQALYRSKGRGRGKVTVAGELAGGSEEPGVG